MYDDLVRSQQRSPLEWLVVNMVIPSLLATFVLQVRAGDETSSLRTLPSPSYTSCFLPVVEEPIDPLPSEFPLLIRMPGPRYPSEMRPAAIEGRVVLKGLVSRAGRVYRSSIRVLTASSEQFVIPAQDALAGAVFRPARWEGRPIEAWVTLTIQFNLRDDTREAR